LSLLAVLLATTVLVGGSVRVRRLLFRRPKKAVLLFNDGEEEEMFKPMTRQSSTYSEGSAYGSIDGVEIM
jgi:hypothetical protein